MCYSLFSSSPVPKHTKHYCLSAGLKWVWPEQGQVLIMIIPISLEQGGFGLCLIKAALQYLRHLLHLYIVGQGLSSSFSSEICMASAEPFFPPLLFIVKPLLPCRKMLSPNRERGVIWSLISSIWRFPDKCCRETSWKPSRSLMNHTVRTVMGMDANVIFQSDS